MPSGLLESDLDQLCILNQNYADWRYFFSKISEEKIGIDQDCKEENQMNNQS